MKRQVSLDDLYARLPDGDHLSSGITMWQGSRDSDRHGELFRLIAAPTPYQ